MTPAAHPPESAPPKTLGYALRELTSALRSGLDHGGSTCSVRNLCGAWCDFHRMVPRAPRCRWWLRVAVHLVAFALAVGWAGAGGADGHLGGPGAGVVMSVVGAFLIVLGVVLFVILGRRRRPRWSDPYRRYQPLPRRKRRRLPAEPKPGHCPLDKGGRK
jgi:hypothetical protein